MNQSEQFNQVPNEAETPPTALAEKPTIPTENQGQETPPAETLAIEHDEGPLQVGYDGPPRPDDTPPQIELNPESLAITYSPTESPAETGQQPINQPT